MIQKVRKRLTISRPESRLGFSDWLSIYRKYKDGLVSTVYMKPTYLPKHLNTKIKLTSKVQSLHFRSLKFKSTV